MFDLGWGEMGVIALVALIVLGPKELPNALRTMTNLTRTARKLAGEFQSGVNEIVREAELEDARKAAQSISKSSISKAIEKVVDPTGEMKTAVKAVESDVNKAKAETQISPVGPIAPPPATPSIAAPTPTIAPSVPEPAPAKAEVEEKAS
jgi:sec-independent protein translocase protein TatB